MHYRDKPRRLNRLASVTALMGALTVAASTHAAHTETHAEAHGANSASTWYENAQRGGGQHDMPHHGEAVHAHDASDLHFWSALALEHADVWSRLRDQLQWQDRVDEPRVQAWIDHYRQSPQNIAEIVERSRPWLAWIVEQVEARDLPGEIALIPFIESSFDPTARSHRGAAGLWQFMPGTGSAMGLRRGNGFDGRLDVVASTQAALDYLQLQAEQWYEGDLELALAAYNAGAGTVNRAQRRATAQGRSGDYWSLSLPRETMNYVPKLQAIAIILSDPEKYQVALPEIENTPAFAKVAIEQPITLDDAARLAGVSRSQLATLNPAATRGVLHPAQAGQVLVPSASAEPLLAGLSEAAAPSGSSDERYVVQRGDSLSAIAARQGVSVAQLRRANGLNGDMIRPGQVLDLPGQQLAAR